MNHRPVSPDEALLLPIGSRLIYIANEDGSYFNRGDISTVVGRTEVALILDTPRNVGAPDYRSYWFGPFGPLRLIIDQPEPNEWADMFEVL